MLLKLFLFLAFRLSLSFCSLYSLDESLVQPLSLSNFSSIVVSSPDVWVVQFYSSIDQNCKLFVPEFERLSFALEGIVKLAAVDTTESQPLASSYYIRNVPTIKLFGSKKESPLEFGGVKSVKEIINWVFEMGKKMAYLNVAELDKEDIPPPPPKKPKEGGKPKQDQENTEKSSVIALTSLSFNRNVFNSQSHWMVEYYAPWCGHCQKLQPEWEAAAAYLKDGVKFGKVDCTVEKKVCSRFGVNGYPAIRYFPPKSSKDSDAVEYERGRDSRSIIMFAIEQRDRMKPGFSVPQLTDQDVYGAFCQSEDVHACVIVFLPHIFDGTAEERNNYIENIKSINAGMKAKETPIGFLWAQGGDFLEFEQGLQLSVGYPTVAAISTQKRKFAIMKGAFSQNQLQLFVDNILNGKEPLYDFSLNPKLREAEKWDGKDHKIDYL